MNVNAAASSINAATIVLALVGLVVGLLTIESNRRLCRRLDAMNRPNPRKR